MWYINETIEQGWPARALDRQIGTLYYERLLTSRTATRVPITRQGQTMLTLNCTKAAAEFFSTTKKGKKTSPLETAPKQSIAESITEPNAPPTMAVAGTCNKSKR